MPREIALRDEADHNAIDGKVAIIGIAEALRKILCDAVRQLLEPMLTGVALDV
jgi:hypothetical protein